MAWDWGQEEVKSDKLDLTGVAKVVDVGSVNAYEIDPTVQGSAAFSAYADGMRFLMKAANGNTGDSTVSLNSMDPKPLVDMKGHALGRGMVRAGEWHLIVYNATIASFVLVGVVPGIVEAFELDGNDDVMPIEGEPNDEDWELDANGDVQPTAQPLFVREDYGIVPKAEDGFLGVMPKGATPANLGVLTGGKTSNATELHAHDHMLGYGGRASLVKDGVENAFATVVIPAGTLKPGDCIRVRFDTSFTRSGSSTYNFALKLNGATIDVFNYASSSLSPARGRHEYLLRLTSLVLADGWGTDQKLESTTAALSMPNSQNIAVDFGAAVTLTLTEQVGTAANVANAAAAWYVEVVRGS